MESPFGMVECEKCGHAVSRARIRRLFWIRVCVDCEKTLSGVRPLGVPDAVDRRLAEEGSGPLQEGLAEGFAGDQVSVRRVLRQAVRPCVLLLAIAIASRFLGPRIASFVGGALAAEVLTWALFSLIRMPFEQLSFVLRLLVRVVALMIVQGPGFPGLAEASRLDYGAVGFFVFLFIRAFWFACWWNELVDDPSDDEAEFDPGVPLGRTEPMVAPTSPRR